MGSYDKKFRINNFTRLRFETTKVRLADIFNHDPESYRTKMEELGFRYVEETDPELEEEHRARPENHRQAELVAFFENQRDLNYEIFEHYSMEKASEAPNYPLMRRYFKTANANLKALLIYGLENYPERIDLLDDLSYFHEFENVLDLLIKYYTRACVMQANMETFIILARDFYYATIEDGYDAYRALRELMDPLSTQRKVLDFMIEEEEEALVQAPHTIIS